MVKGNFCWTMDLGKRAPARQPFPTYDTMRDVNFCTHPFASEFLKCSSTTTAQTRNQSCSDSVVFVQQGTEHSTT